MRSTGESLPFRSFSNGRVAHPGPAVTAIGTPFHGQAHLRQSHPRHAERPPVAEDYRNPAGAASRSSATLQRIRSLARRDVHRTGNSSPSAQCVSDALSQPRGDEVSCAAVQARRLGELNPTSSSCCLRGCAWPFSCGLSHRIGWLTVPSASRSGATLHTSCVGR